MAQRDAFPAMAAMLREQVNTPEVCDRPMDDAGFAAGRGLRNAADFMRWADAEGDEAMQWEAGQLFDRWCHATDDLIGFILRWKATLEAEAEQRPGRQS